MRIEYTAEARRELRSLDKHDAVRILKKVSTYGELENPLTFAKPLEGTLAGLYRFRVGDYRIIFSLDESGSVTILVVLKVAHRKDIYR